MRIGIKSIQVKTNHSFHFEASKVPTTPEQLRSTKVRQHQLDPAANMDMALLDPIAHFYAQATLKIFAVHRCKCNLPKAWQTVPSTSLLPFTSNLTLQQEAVPEE
jgi:hypothetical protein